MVVFSCLIELEFQVQELDAGEIEDESVISKAGSRR